MDEGVDARSSELRPQPFTIGTEHREQVVHVTWIMFGRHGDRKVSCKFRPISLRQDPARLSPSRKKRQSCSQHGRLYLVQTGIHAELAVLILARLSTVAEAPRLFGEPDVRERDRTAISQRTKVLGGIETVGCGLAETSDRLAIAGGEMRLAAVLDDRETVPGRD